MVWELQNVPTFILESDPTLLSTTLVTGWYGAKQIDAIHDTAKLPPFIMSSK